ncbi:MAG: twin-arginine translocase subunit TatC [Sphingomonadales bacterium]|nr:twin-arginine translocase subunit TatC [Sphingomonadales bacterium]
MSEDQPMSFLDHLEELRWRLLRSAIAVVIFAVVIWTYQREIMEHIFLNMVDADFITFKLMCQYLGVCVDPINVDFQSTTLAGQFSYALMMCIMGGVVLAFPYIFYQLWAFVKPGLKSNEKKMAKGIVFYVSLLFFLGILFGYYVVAPLSVQFFGAFQITPEIKTDVTIASYMSTILSTVFYTGLFFLFPIVTFLLVKIGLFTPAFLVKYRKHAIVVILILAAVITPPDIISQIIVTIPIYILFELSIIVSKRAASKVED